VFRTRFETTETNRSVLKQTENNEKIQQKKKNFAINLTEKRKALVSTQNMYFKSPSSGTGSAYPEVFGTHPRSGYVNFFTNPDAVPDLDANLIGFTQGKR
jgi:hypothetical protein